ncbi:transposable element Tcb1 transposase [Trichonephila clavipes]|nr:transposable element Tcb1 transposase [Trichonephila clavipes]GFV26216.1 transposable element Tcb1 transposase [Trichonephila clavipes]
MDDNACPHRADIVDDDLESEGIKRMAWPAYSSDLNPIENLWDALGRAVSSRFPPPSTLIELETSLQEEWRSLNPAVVDHLIESMVRSQIKAYEIHHGKGLDVRLKKRGGGLGASRLSSPTTNLTREPVARRLLRVAQCHEGTIHLQNSMTSPGFEPRLYGTVVKSR